MTPCLTASEGDLLAGARAAMENALFHLNFLALENPPAWALLSRTRTNLASL